jgi:hypothetical protein
MKGGSISRVCGPRDQHYTQCHEKLPYVMGGSSDNLPVGLSPQRDGLFPFKGGDKVQVRVDAKLKRVILGKAK